MTTDPDSPAIQLIRLVWDNVVHHRKKTSWTRVDFAMGWALKLAIKSGFRFARSDFETMAREFTITVNELHYTLACGVDIYGHSHCYENLTAAVAFETWKNRNPFILQTQPHYLVRHRIAVGSRFPWYGTWVNCTSFAEDGQSLIACSYKDAEGTKGIAIAKRNRITHADIVAYHRKLREYRRNVS